MAAFDMEGQKISIKKFEAGSKDPVTYFYMDGKYKNLANIGFGFHFKKWQSYVKMIHKNSIVFHWKDISNKSEVKLKDIQKDHDLVVQKNADLKSAEGITHTRADIGGLNRAFDNIYSEHENSARSWYNSNAGMNTDGTQNQMVNLSFDLLPPEAKYVLIDMFYNAGSEVMNEFRSLKKAIKNGDWKKAAKECRFKEYANQGGIKTRNDKKTELLLSLANSSGSPDFSLSRFDPYCSFIILNQKVIPHALRSRIQIFKPKLY